MLLGLFEALAWGFERDTGPALSSALLHEIPGQCALLNRF